MNALLFLIFNYIPYLFGGGVRRYRVRQVSDHHWVIDMFGGGMGPVWRASLREGVGNFSSRCEASLLAEDFARHANGIVVPYKGGRPHIHKTETGLLVKCYHSSRNTLLSFNFWLGITLSFPLEHVIWTKVWPFYLVTEYFHLMEH